MSICGEVQGKSCGVCQLGDCVDNIACCVAPEEVSVTDTPGEARGLFVSGEVLYVADFGQGLQLFDISNVAAPTLTGTLNDNSFAWDVDVAAGRAYVAWAYAGLVVVDVSTPGTPTMLGAELSAGGTGVAFDGNHAYVAAGAGDALRIVDVSNAAAPMLVGTAPVAQQALRVAVSQGYAYVTVEDGTLAVIDASDPSDPFQTATFTAQGVPSDVVVNGNTAYVAEGYFGVEMVDISDPANPTLIGAFPIEDNSGAINGIDVSGGQLAVARGSETLFLDVSDPSAPFELGHVSAPAGGEAVRVVFNGDYAFVGAGTAGVQAIRKPECEG